MGQIKNASPGPYSLFLSEQGPNLAYGKGFSIYFDFIDITIKGVGCSGRCCDLHIVGVGRI
jgi:hypothetical protein